MTDPRSRRRIRYLRARDGVRLAWGLITEGLANAQIAGRLGLSEKTVRNHLSRVFDKPGVYTRAQAIVFARDRGTTTGADAPS